MGPETLDVGNTDSVWIEEMNYRRHAPLNLKCSRD